MQKPIHVFNRYSGAIEEEEIYGEAFLKWIYGHPLGRLALWGVAKRRFFSRFYGWRMSRPASRKKVAPFVATYGLNEEEFLQAKESFGSFNAFFSRRLRPDARPIASAPSDVVFPADGRHLAIPVLGREEGFFVKGQRFDLAKLLDDAELAHEFAGGTLVLSRLCPVDYHRFHFPVEGRPERAMRIGGPLFSVSPIALRQRLSYLWENARVRVVLDGGPAGKVVTVDVGATCVGSIHYTYTPREDIARGDEKGFFEFGGSSTITLFKQGVVCLADDLLSHSAKNQEVYARMGDRMGRLVSC